MKLNKNQLLLLLLVGILLLVISIPTESGKAIIDTQTDVEKRLTSILEKIEGVGEVRVMITLGEKDKIEGVVVVAEGGNQPIIVRNIMEVIEALFDVETHKIKVIKGGE